jgi:hypothetical protein
MDFQTWVKGRMKLPSESDEVVALIRRAGPRGISFSQLWDQVKFPTQLLDDLLKELLAAGQISRVGTNGKTVFLSVEPQ